MSKGITLTIDNKELIKLNKEFKVIASKVNAAGNDGLEKVAADILKDAQYNLEKDGKHVTGQAQNSGRIEKQSDGTIDVGFIAKHAGAIEFGRKAGLTPPPYRPILEWIKRKHILDTINLKTGKENKRGSATSYSNIKTRKTTNVSDYYKKAIGMAIATAKKIGEKGIKASPFLYPAFRKNEQEVLRILGNAIKKVI